MIDVERHGRVALLRMDHGKVNAMDVELLVALASALADLEAEDVGAAVLTGNARVFSAGVDLRRYVEGGPEYVDALLPALSDAFLAVVRARFPVVAAVNGAAIAGGAVLAASCDRRLLATDARIGASELLVGVPFPVAAIEILAARCGRRTGEAVWTGRLWTDDAAVAAGLADEVVDAGSLEAAALDAAGALAAMPSEVTAMTKAYLWSSVLERVAERRAIDDAVRERWAATDTLERVAAYLETTTRR
ncbi:enoyl-CoA hydratase/isomerase family protein [Acidiferrimicrobium sp. IK]|uniref:enoyl-CoA hydratase/isomerase family protein n=1 Tax=Acidiferrimicrobium sp. IK TaxID=2871700 RepID=UPI0021CB2EAC|nr:enoyl-CoA hydratase/isomerase family protein [Acidiferrimicrobium sp. IK]MCU4186027.1 enoyl-CoA hydratase/isomerase family protein [Acidiferrimicrobium sp. IK]